MPSYNAQLALKRLGHNIRIARKKRRMSVADFCERLGVTDKTLAKLEAGDGGVRLETLAMALLVLGELHRLDDILDPANDATGLMLDLSRLPKRIATRRAKPGNDAKHGLPPTDPFDPDGVAF